MSLTPRYLLLSACLAFVLYALAGPAQAVDNNSADADWCQGWRDAYNEIKGELSSGSLTPSQRAAKQLRLQRIADMYNEHCGAYGSSLDPAPIKRPTLGTFTRGIPTLVGKSSPKMGAKTVAATPKVQRSVLVTKK